MKHLLSGLLGGGLFLLSSAAELSLTEIPATDAAAFWTWNGPSLPLRNRNLSGGTIRIGSVEFPEGLCGHTPFSCVYRLDGLADAFSAEIGVEANDHENDPIRPGDPPPEVTFRCLADFKEVFRKKCALGEAPYPVRIDLRGVRHFEIQAKASGGRTSHRCRTALGNPVFRTAKGEALNRILVENARRTPSAPHTPDPPSWETVSLRKIRFGETTAYRIRNRTMELILAPENGGRILHLSRPGGTNLLAPEKPFPAEGKKIRGAFPDCTSGHFLRLLPPPALLPDDPVLETMPYTVEFPEEGIVVLRSGESRVHEISAEYRIQILPDAVEITNTIRNLSSFSRKLGVWSLTRIDTRVIRFFRISDAEGKVFPLFPNSLRPEREIPAEGRVRIAVLCRDGSVFTIHAETARCLKFYRSPRFTEAEVLGRCVPLAPGEQLSLKERWELGEELPEKSGSGM